MSTRSLVGALTSVIPSGVCGARDLLFAFLFVVAQHAAPRQLFRKLSVQESLPAAISGLT